MKCTSLCVIFFFGGGGGTHTQICSGYSAHTILIGLEIGKNVHLFCKKKRVMKLLLSTVVILVRKWARGQSAHELWWIVGFGGSCQRFPSSISSPVVLQRWGNGFPHTRPRWCSVGFACFCLVSLHSVAQSMSPNSVLVLLDFLNSSLGY